MLSETQHFHATLPFVEVLLLQRNLNNKTYSLWFSSIPYSSSSFYTQLDLFEMFNYSKIFLGIIVYTHIL